MSRTRIKPRKAIVLLSGGIDSTTTLFLAKKKGYKCFALIFDYGQRHRTEVIRASRIARLSGTPYQIVKIRLPWKGSALLDRKKKLPKGRSLKKMSREVPSTYVPARNTIFLSFALSYAEAIGANAVFIGANAIDFSGYPDCRPSYYKVWQKLTREALKNKGIRIFTPLIKKTKVEIIKLGKKLGAPLEKTWSCYAGGKKPCGVCDSCRIREAAFSSIRA
jgi:7-cyano-7-deazaguanine synthase